jgi:hypothetical protein
MDGHDLTRRGGIIRFIEVQYAKGFGGQRPHHGTSIFEQSQKIGLGGRISNGGQGSHGTFHQFFIRLLQ